MQTFELILSDESNLIKYFFDILHVALLIASVHLRKNNAGISVFSKVLQPTHVNKKIFSLLSEPEYKSD